MRLRKMEKNGSGDLFRGWIDQIINLRHDLCTQPTMSRLENMPSRIEAARMTAALVDTFCRSFPQVPATITPDIDGHPRLGAWQPAAFAVPRPP